MNRLHAFHDHRTPLPDQAETQLDTPLISVVVPVHNEAPNLLPLITAIGAALAGIEHEIVYVDDGSSDATPSILAETAWNLPNFVHIRHRNSCGQSAAVITGVRAARGIYIATLDGDGQNDPADIPAMLEAAMAAEAFGPKPVLIAGHRTTRKDSEAKRWGSRIANSVRGRLLKDGTPDTGCGLKLVPPGRLSGSAAFRPSASLPAGLVHPRRRPCRLGAGAASSAHARRLALRHLGPVKGRHCRSVRRRLAAAPLESTANRSEPMTTMNNLPPPATATAVPIAKALKPALMAGAMIAMLSACRCWAPPRRNPR